jgi:hypothetical protein
VLTGQLSLSAVRDVGKYLLEWLGWVFQYCSECLCLLHIARYLVDPASSHMLVSKIKPCMSKYKPE